MAEAPKKLVPKRGEEIAKIITELVVMKHRLAKLGLWRTFHKMDEVTRQAGWEFADIISGKQV